MTEENESSLKKKFAVIVFVLVCLATVFFMNYLIHTYYQKDYAVKQNQQSIIKYNTKDKCGTIFLLATQKLVLSSSN